MALNFPDSPSDGTSENGFTYDSTQGVWNKDQLTTAQQTVVSDTAPTNPKGGDLWWNSTDLKLYIYYNDADSGQWASVRTEGAQGPVGSKRSFTNISSFTNGKYVGELAVANDTKAVYMWDGSAWKRFNVGADEFPSFTTQPSSTLNLSPGANSTITVAAEDPEGFPITYSHMLTPSNPNSVTSITNSGGTFTLVPSSNTAHTDSFVIKFLADDGVHKTVSTSTSVSISHFSGVFAMWADGTVIKAHSGASVATNGTTSVSDSTISRDGLRIADAGDYISFTGLPDFKLDPGSSDNYIVWAMKFPTPLDAYGYGMVIRDMNNHNVGFIDSMRWFGNGYSAAGAVNSRWYMSLQGGAGYNTQLAGNGGFPNYGADKYWVFVSKGGFGTMPYVKEVGGSGTMARLERGSTGEGRTGYAGSDNNQITFFGGSPHNNSIANVSGGSNNEGSWKIDVAAVAVYPSSMGTVEQVAADFATVIGS
jgi:hypothetical protein